MFLRIGFENGSNPCLKYGNADELTIELSRWRHNYSLEVEQRTSEKTGVVIVYMAYAVERNAAKKIDLLG